MVQPTAEEVLIEIYKGIKNAKSNYMKSAGIPFWQGPEYLMTMSIYHSLFNLTKGDSLTLEIKQTVIKDYLKGKCKGRPLGKARLNGRADICLWFTDTARPRALIEVKRNATKCYSDLHRVVSLTKFDGGLQFGVLVGCLWKKIEIDNKNDVMEKIQEDQKKYLKISKTNCIHIIIWALSHFQPLSNRQSLKMGKEAARNGSGTLLFLKFTERVITNSKYSCFPFRYLCKYFLF